MNREQSLAEIQSRKDKYWDVVIVGGGATGLGIAVDAVTRGYKTLLIEQSDFSKGTSSRSTKLVHGGVRYLAQGDILLVYEALHERGIMLKNAPHLCSDQEFIVPVFSWREIFLYTTGLKLYDILAGKLSLGKSYFTGREETLGRLPGLIPRNLKGGVVYHDGRFDDSRMALTLAAACSSEGGTLLNYCRVEGLLKDAGGKINGVLAKDLESGTMHRISSGLVINATGIFADSIHRMDDPASAPTIRPSQGVHLVLDRSFLSGGRALMIPKTDDGRVLFIIPWYDRLVAGTTDTPIDNIAEEPRALDVEVDFILDAAGRYLTRKPVKEDILCIFAGMRPLAADPDNHSSTREISRRHKITVSGSGLISIVGGKWTSYRLMAEDTIDMAIKKKLLRRAVCRTKDFRLDHAVTDLKYKRLLLYGKGATEIERMINEKPELGKQLHPSLPYTEAEITWICRNEMPVKLEDVLARRTRALFLDVRAGIDIAPRVAGIMAAETGRSKEWEKDQIDEYKRLSMNYL